MAFFAIIQIMIIGREGGLGAKKEAKPKLSLSPHGDTSPVPMEPEPLGATIDEDMSTDRLGGSRLVASGRLGENLAESREQRYTERVMLNVARIESMSKVSLERSFPLADLMSGDFEIFPNDGVVAPTHSANRRLAQAGIRKGAMLDSKSGKRKLGYGVFRPAGEEIYSPPDTGLPRCKFYLALGSDNGDPVTLQQQEDFLFELVKTAVESGIDISWKHEIHGYDQPCIYTYQPEALATIIKELYSKYDESMWRNVGRIFQGQVSDTIPVEHIGWVQEPGGIGGGSSHSTRMFALGNEYNAMLHAGKSSHDAYVAACVAVGVRPDMPWLLSTEEENRILEVRRAVSE